LEEQAKALFKSWFIDFEPFKGGKFIDSELGMIPEGWEACPLEQLGKFKRGKTIVAKEATKGDVPVVAGGIDPAYYNNVANTKGPVITVSASGANAGFMRLYYQDVWASDCSFLDNSNENLLWIYCFLNNNRRVLRHAQTGAVQPHVKPADINSIIVCIPPHDLISKFQNTVSPLFKSIGLHQKETKRLQETRDALLPKLMSGKIDVDQSKLLFICLLFCILSSSDDRTETILF
jgi:type I restriction enzyme S subunit